MVDRRHYKIVGLAILFLLCWMGYVPQSCSSTVVWSDNFDDGNYDGWTICENSRYSSGSAWLATNNYLELNQSGFGIISHPSDVAYGSWSFDFRANESQVELQTKAEIVFISSNLDGARSEDWYGYWVEFRVSSISPSKNFTLSLRRGDFSGVLVVIDGYYTPVPVAGWHHINVTRDTNGLFKVYHNGDIIMQGEDTTFQTSELFAFYVEKWQMIDNIVVDNEPPQTTTNSEFPDWWIVVIIGASAVVIIAVLVVILKRR